MLAQAWEDHELSFCLDFWFFYYKTLLMSCSKYSYYR